MNRRVFFVITFLLLSFSIFSKETIYVLTIPKSGTHCFQKYIRLLNFMNIELPFGLIYSHLSESYLNLPPGSFEQPNVKKIVLIRDLRDVFISGYHHIIGYKNWLMDDFNIIDLSWDYLSFDQKIIELINYERESKYYYWKHNDRNLPQQIKKTIQKAIRYSQFPNTIVIRFEDLSGGNGITSQKETIRNLNSFIGISLSEEQLDLVSNSIFGNNLLPGQLFRVGECNQWKSIFTPFLCDIIKSLYGQDLIDLGYEKDLSWSSSIQK